jgi:hypothetical protein
MAAEIACPFVYANGRKCSGHITRVEAYKCDVTWMPDADGRWRPSVNEVRSHYHLFCLLARWFGSIEDSGEVPLGESTEGSGTLGEK